jgi:hypothetical protein
MDLKIVMQSKIPYHGFHYFLSSVFCYIFVFLQYIYLFPLRSAYYCENWKYRGVPCKTNTAANALTRSPGTVGFRGHAKYILYGAGAKGGQAHTFLS